MLIAQISDTHIVCPSIGRNKFFVEERIRNLKNCANTIKNLENKPNAIIHTGDVSHNGLIQEYKIVADILNPLNIPILYTPGNRDKRENLKLIFKHFDVRNLKDNFFIYPKEFKDFRLVSMDTHCETSNMGEFTNERLEIFSKILLKKQSMPTAIFMHHPPFDVSDTKTKNIEYKSEKLFPKFIEILKKHNNLVGLFCGHIHRNIKRSINNVVSYTMPPVAIDISKDGIITPNLKKIQFLLHSHSENTGIFTKKILVQ
tara:strand:+ start:667 stop:1440 length:774 start_codon:yes stop_codon:yes gene_type:complete